MARISIVAALLLLCGSGYHAPRQRHECYAIVVVAAAAKERTTILTPSKHQQRSKKMKLSVETSYQQEHDSTGDDRQVIPWVSIAVLLNILFFFRSFAAPFFDPLGEPRQATADSVYFSLISFLYIWLSSVTTLTVLPQYATNYNIIIATALFFYLVFVSICALLMGRLIIRGLYYIWLFWKNGRGSGALEKQMNGSVNTIYKYIRRKSVIGNQTEVNGEANYGTIQIRQKKIFFPELIAFQRPFRRVIKTSLFLSAVLCFIYAHCWSRTMSAFKTHDGGLVCRAIFFPFQQPVRERCIWILWAVIVTGHLWAYVMNEFAGKHHKDYRAARYSSTKRSYDGGGAPIKHVEMEASKSSSSFDVDSPIEGVDSNEYEDEMEEDDEDYSPRINNKEVADPWQAIIQKFVNRKREQPTGALPMVSWYSNVVFTTGFDMLISFKVFLGRFDARKMQVALLETGPQNSESSLGSAFDFSHCKHSSAGSSQDDGFWFDFVSDVGDGFNSSYQVSRLLAQPTLDIDTPSLGRRTLPRGKLLINGGDLAYPDPTPENYEDRFFRTFEDALPPPPSFRKEHISIRKPALPVEGWDTADNGKKEDTDNLLSGYEGPCAFLIPGNHDWFDGLSTFTRYILARDWLGGWLMPQRTSYFATKLPKGWWVLGFDLALDDDINIEQFQFFAEVAASMKPDDSVIIVSHVPHWILNEYENHAHDGEKENNLSELVKTHLKGRVKLRLAGDLHHYTRHIPVSKPGNDIVNAVDKPTLIVSGGGGAFLHPTHTFHDKITVEKDEYSRVCAYPSTKVSQNLSWLNLWQFRWRNWRLDILWAVTHFGICTSLFPLCGIYDDYQAHTGSILTWAFRRVMLLFTQIFMQGRVSLFFTLVVTGIAYTFADSSCLKARTHLAWSMAHASAQIFSALLCILFVECMVEMVVSEGLVVVATQKIASDGLNSESCGTGLASTIFDEYTIHFSHTLEDFKLLNMTNSTTCAPEALHSYRIDERFYEMVSSIISWLYREAPFLKTTLSVFDLPGIIGSTHVEMCDLLCSGGTECIFSNDFVRYQQIDRGTILKYLASICLYYIIFAVPLAGNVMGSWLHLSLNYLKCQYDEGFSSLRMEHWKNFLRLHIDEDGDLEIFAVGLHRVPKKWRKDPAWDGYTAASGGDGTSTVKPSWKWGMPSKWIPWRNRKKFTPQLIDHTKIKRR